MALHVPSWVTHLSPDDVSKGIIKMSSADIGDMSRNYTPDQLGKVIEACDSEALKKLVDEGDPKSLAKCIKTIGKKTIGQMSKEASPKAFAELICASSGDVVDIIVDAVGSTEFAGALKFVDPENIHGISLRLSPGTFGTILNHASGDTIVHIFEAAGSTELANALHYVDAANIHAISLRIAPDALGAIVSHLEGADLDRVFDAIGSTELGNAMSFVDPSKLAAIAQRVPAETLGVILPHMPGEAVAKLFGSVEPQYVAGAVATIPSDSFASVCIAGFAHLDDGQITEICKFIPPKLLSELSRLRDRVPGLRNLPDPLDIVPRIFGVDGTGSADEDEYKKKMANSFINRIHRTNAEAVYYRGANNPDEGDDGVWTPNVVGDVTKQHLMAPNAAIFLAGYSRGGAAVIDVAVQLKALGIVIEAMFLFDAVSRSARLLGYAIPNNVRNCYHVIRNPASNSRKSFGGCGTVCEPGVKFITNLFMTTHGGMGAAPWRDTGLVMSTTREDKAPAWAIKLAEENPALQSVIFEGKPDWQFTTITLDQEVNGMDEVESWMKVCLISHGLTF